MRIVMRCNFDSETCLNFSSHEFLSEVFEGFFITILITILVTIFVTEILLRKRAPATQFGVSDAGISLQNVEEEERAPFWVDEQQWQ